MNIDVITNCSFINEEVDHLVNVFIAAIAANPNAEFYDFAMETLEYLGVEFIPEEAEGVKVH